MFLGLGARGGARGERALGGLPGGELGDLLVHLLDGLEIPGAQLLQELGTAHVALNEGGIT